MTPLERAVIQAARDLVAGTPAPWSLGEHLTRLAGTLKALDVAQSDAGQEIEWHEIAAGDEVKSRNNGKFYPVTGVIALKDGRRQVTLDLNGNIKAIVRPTPEEPRAIVRRGQSGKAVDLFVNVFSSGVG